ncbi:MAG: 2-oxoacid:acceptor oxidoreductase subunit alpha [Acidobacteria bacterium]|nr:2-oxoacid:acceptor oxidoreductase subunit alpha [Acidobacteriota bacterium]MBI3656204.1 2-oxoacid:acceptor oxidoreductase subunit alpha [Acidobacteriota bacterium]
MPSERAVPAEEREWSSHDGLIINNFCIQAATVNGSGSQSANLVLLRAIFQMGVPVSGKNIFPSNIAGLPTWYTIRASQDGYVAHKKDVDVLIALNSETAADDIRKIRPHAAVIYEESLPLARLRDDLYMYPVPFSKLAAQVSGDARARRLLINMIYVGVAAELLSIDFREIEVAIRRLFKSKSKAAESNIKAVQIGADYARAHLPKLDPFKIQRMDKTRGKIIIDGNSAAAIGCLYAGCTVVAWYPITPSSSLCETVIEYFKRFRIDEETGKATFAIVQAEDELAALGMVLGAGWTGARAMTSTSGPGISLMAEFTGLGYYAEVPAVIFDVQRLGPSTGLPTRTSQGDIFSVALLSHGDTKHIVLIPGSVEECYSMAIAAFDLAERFQTPVFVMSDLDLGMNNWMSEPFEYPEKPIDRGKVLTAEDLSRIGHFERYRDVDGDGIPYRTLPGTNHPLAGYFTRGSGHNEKAQYSEKPQVYVDLMNRLAKKYETARQYVPRSVVESADSAEIGIIAYGTTHYAILEARDQLEALGTPTDYLRLRAIPFGPEVGEFVRRRQRIYVVEQNRDGQMADLIRLEVAREAGKIRSLRHFTGLPIDARFVTESILSREREGD